MRHIKEFKIFESDSDDINPKAKEFLDNYLAEITYEIVTDSSGLNSWLDDEVPKKIVDDYKNSKEFKTFTEEQVEESDEYKDSVADGEDPDEMLKTLTDYHYKWDTYMEEFIKEKSDEVRKDLQSEVEFLDKVNFGGYYERQSKTSEYTVISTKPEDLPRVSIEGSLTVEGYDESFLPVSISSISPFSSIGPDKKELKGDFQSVEVQDVQGEFTLYATDVIALNNGPEECENLYISKNSRLISLESVQYYRTKEIENNNFLDAETLMSSIGIDNSSIKTENYYFGLLSNSKFPEFDEEQLEFLLDKLGYDSMQDLIDDRPSETAIALKSNWNKMKKNDIFSDLKFPESHSGNFGTLTDLSDIGI